MTTQPDAKTTVFYDGSCPLCRSEIGFYQRQRGADGVSFVDVSACEFALVAPDLSKADAMARFHVRDGDGKLVSGAGAFATLWTVLPTFSLVGRIANLPGIRHGLEAAYRAFLPLRPWLQRRAAKANAAVGGFGSKPPPKA
jgi:predicted DCC family thiol-disulfide oxidoreductase YuxK